MTETIPDLITKKRDGLELKPEEIQQFIRGLSTGDVQDCHVGAMLMAIFIRGSIEKEKRGSVDEIFSSSS